MIYLPEIEEIYFDNTKIYFNEVLSSYMNGNYRSALVMLYTTVICDLYYKLQELRDLYNDEKSKKILEKIEKERRNKDNFSRWEKDLIETIYKETELITNEVKASLGYLIDLRNLSAHPAMNDNFDLVVPNKEEVIALIKKCLNGIFIKAPLFISDIVDEMTEDLKKKREIYESSPEELLSYVNRKYIFYMSDSMKKKVFKAYWKFCFILLEDEECNKNRKINNIILGGLIRDNQELLLQVVENENKYFSVSMDDNCNYELSRLLAKYPRIYDFLDDTVKFQINQFAKTNHDIAVLSWFENDKVTHINRLINNKEHYKLKSSTMEMMECEYINEGLYEKYLDYMITSFAVSASFDDANERYYVYIDPYLREFNKDQFINLLNVMNSNDQIYNRIASYRTTTNVLLAGKDKLEPVYDISVLHNLKYDEKTVDYCYLPF